MCELDAVIFQSDLSLLYIRIDIRHTSGGVCHLVLLALATEMAVFESIEEMVGREAAAVATESGGTVATVATESGGTVATESCGAGTTGDETVATVRRRPVG